MSVSMSMTAATPTAAEQATATDEIALSLANVNLFYGAFRAVKDVTLDIRARSITAIIGPRAAASRRCCAR